jgi:putative lipoic acid-binding regulatory protein
MKKQIMDNSSEDTLGEGLTFPCQFVIKVFGNASNELEDVVLTIIRKTIPTISVKDIQIRPSKNGKYDALSIAIDAQSREQLDAIYRDLTSHPLILMVL